MDLRDRVDQLAELAEEFRLSEAELSGDGFRVSFKKAKAARSATPTPDPELEMGELLLPDDIEPELAKPVVPQGTPVNSPMNGIYYASPSPSAPPFVKEGENVSAGQVVGLIEAMKVFNEIVAPISGTVQKVVAVNGQLVQPGDLLLLLG